MAKPEASASGYRIGTVSKLTGISPDTLRIWERRYEVVTPQRSAGGGRLYTTEDITRLKLIRRLVDKGDAIGDTYDSVENLTGSSFNDRLFGDMNDNVIVGGDGDDLLYGLDGGDTMVGGDGFDSVTYYYATGPVTVSLKYSKVVSW